MEGYSDKLDSNSTSTTENGTLLPSVNIEFVGLNAESWKRMIEIGALNPYLCKTSSYFDNQTEKHQEIIHELEWYRCNWCKDAVNRQNSLAGHLRNHHEDHVEINSQILKHYRIPTLKLVRANLFVKGKMKTKKSLVS